MIRARVIGEVWATRKAPGLDGRRLVLCAAGPRVMVAIDTLDAREGQEVLVSVGSGARNVLLPGPDNRQILCDAAVSLIIDGEILMFLAKVVGTVWSSVKWPELAGLKLLLVRPYSLADLERSAVDPTAPEEGVVCADVLGAGPGEDVVIAYGHAARVAVSQVIADGEKPNVPIDAAVVAIVDRFAVSSAD